VDVEFPEQVADVVLHLLLEEAEGVADLTVAETD